MNFKKMTLFSSSILLTVSPVAIMLSCSSSVDQKFIDDFYDNITQKTDWTGNNDTYASSIYDLFTFRRVFKDQLPTNEELLAKGFQAVLEVNNAEDNFGASTYTLYLRNMENTITYLPTPKPITEDSENKEAIISFTIKGFLQTTDAIVQEFATAYEKVPSTYPLNIVGKNFFETQNITNNISFNNPASPYYLGKLFDFSPIANFEIGSFEEISIDEENKVISFRLYLAKNLKVKGPGREVTLSL